MNEIVHMSSLTDEMDDVNETSPQNYSPVPMPQDQTQQQIENQMNKRKSKKGKFTCKLCLKLCCEINCCGQMMGSKYAEQLRSFSFFINFFAVVLLGFALGINDLTSTQCGWNMDTKLDISFSSLCSDAGNSGYCEAEKVGYVWFIGSIIAMVMNIVAAMINCQYDKYAADIKNGKRSDNPLPRNSAAYINLITGIIIITSNIIFEFGQNVCLDGPSNWGSSMISAYTAGALLLTFGFWIFPLMLMVCIFA